MVNQQRISDEFMCQAAIDSPSFHEAAIAKYLKSRFEKLGAKVEIDNAGERVGSDTGNLIARIPGTKQGEPLLLSAHMDTVTPAKDVTPVLKDGVFTSAGDTILGGDDKSGIVAIIEAIETLTEQKIPHVPLEIVISICEEQGLLGAKQLDFSQFKAKRAIALDTRGTDIIINRAPAANRFKIDIFGHEAHAGVCPEAGISAIQIASRAIARMTLGRIDEETTANIGTIHGGMASNIIPGQISLRGEVRSHNTDKLSQLTESIISTVEDEVQNGKIETNGKSVQATMAIELSDDYPPMQVADTAGIVKLICAAGETLNRPQDVQSAGGGSDANIFNNNGIEMVIMGTGMEKVHTIDEYITLADMVKTSALLTEVIRQA